MADSNFRQNNSLLIFTYCLALLFCYACKMYCTNDAFIVYEVIIDMKIFEIFPNNFTSYAQSLMLCYITSSYIDIKCMHNLMLRFQFLMQSQNIC